MRAWWALAVIVGATAGCDAVLGLETRPGPDVSVTDLRVIGTPPVIDDLREVRATVHGAPNALQAYELTATAGDLIPRSGELVLDVDGEAELTSMYRATVRGPVTIAALAGTASATVTFAVFELVIAGVETGTITTAIAQNRYIGTRINLAEAGELRSLGLATNITMSPMGRFGVYTNAVDRPGQLLVALSGTHALTDGRNMFALPPTRIEAGDYWVVGIFDASATILSTPTSAATYGFVSGSFTDPMPTSLPGWGTVTGSQLAYFIGVQVE